MTNASLNLFRQALPVLLSGLAYVVVLIISLRLLARGIDSKAVATLVSLAPMVPALLMAVAIVRLNGQRDEMQRRTQLEAVTIAFVGTALITFGYGFLENVGYPRLSAFVVWPLMAGLWVLGGAIATL